MMRILTLFAWSAVCVAAFFSTIDRFQTQQKQLNILQKDIHALKKEMHFLTELHQQSLPLKEKMDDLHKKGFLGRIDLEKAEEHLTLLIENQTGEVTQINWFPPLQENLSPEICYQRIPFNLTFEAEEGFSEEECLREMTALFPGVLEINSLLQEGDPSNPQLTSRYHLDGVWHKVTLVSH